MDQKSPNGAGKMTWREKLGIGAKDLPKIADEFQPARPQAPEPRLGPRPPAGANGEGVRSGHQAVVRPAPMAPRPQTRTPAEASSPAPAAPQGADSLADRLKAQREAAEKRAEQRVSAARERTELKPEPPLPNAGPAPAARPRSERPKFTFADEELAAAQDEASEAPLSPRPAAQPPLASPDLKSAPGAGPAEMPLSAKPQTEPPGLRLPPVPPPAGPPLVPPRPALGGDPPAPRQPLGSGETRMRPPQFQPRFQPAAPGYRPLDPPSSFTQRGPGTGAYRSAYSGDATRPPLRREPTVAPRRPPAGETHHPGQDPAREPARRLRPLSLRGRQAAYDDDLNEVFEDEAPRRRASAQDYAEAYQDYEGGAEPDRRRAGGPWLLLLALVLAAVLAGGGVWYYNTYIKSTDPAAPATANIPVVPAPEQPAKEVPAVSTDAQAPAPEQPTKQIYDRILGEETLEGDQIAPTEPPPVAPEAPAQQTPPSSDTTIGAAPVPEPSGIEPPAPAADPDAADAPAEPLPLPLPPTPGEDGAQGALPAPAAQTATIEPVRKEAKTDAVRARPVLPEEITGEAIAPIAGEQEAARLAAATETQSPPPQTEEPAAEPEAPPVVEPPKAKTKKARATKKSKDTEQPAAEDALPIEPVVLVPPAATEAAAAEPSGPVPLAPATEPLATNTEQATPKPSKSGWLSKLIKGSGSGQSKPPLTGKNAENARDQGKVSALAPTTDAPAPITADTQVAALDQAAEPTLEPQAPVETSNYIVQLGSFRSEKEARAELDRLRSRHGAILSTLEPRITEATVSGSRRYRAGMGTLASREAADQLCNSLVAAGERDCLVRQP